MNVESTLTGIAAAAGVVGWLEVFGNVPISEVCRMGWTMQDA
jgi:hypothetical protein